MPTIVPKLSHFLENLPREVSECNRFLLWKLVPRQGKKPRKIPYYVSGKVRGDKLSLDSEEDKAQLASIEEAVRAATDNGYSGIGIALTGDGLCAFDVDNCLNESNQVLLGHAGVNLIEDLSFLGAYIERSPSGRGLRILGRSDELRAYSKDNVEFWGQGRFVTITGDVWSNPRGWVNLTPFRKSLLPEKTPDRSPPPEEGAPSAPSEDRIVTRKTLEELQSALASMSSDERELWIRMGMALKGLGDKGFDLWMEWSKKSDLFDHGDAVFRWETFQPTRTGFPAVFAEAQANWGWENPRRRQQRDSSENPSSEPATLNFLDLGNYELFPTEFVLDGFLPVGVSLIAGAWGAGKSTNLIPLFASVAHLSPTSWGFRPQLRRHVIWMTEAPEQARDTLYSLTKDQESASWDEVKTWFHVVPSKRRAPKVLAKLLEKVAKELAYEHEASGFVIKPLVVLDTTSANLDLENESDNSEVGAAMAALKESLSGYPLVLVGHTPKALIKSDITDMTFRGAGAWEADAVATYYLVHDPDTGMRFMAIRKSRFSPDYPEISFGEAGGREIIATPWGDDQSKAFLHGVPCRSTGEERKAAQEQVKQERKEEERERNLTGRQSKIVEAISKGAEDFTPLTKESLKDVVGGNSDLRKEALNRLLEGGLVIAVTPTPEVRESMGFKGRVPELLLPGETDVEVYFESLREDLARRLSREPKVG